MSLYIAPESLNWIAAAALAAYALAKIDWKAAFPRRDDRHDQ